MKIERNTKVMGILWVFDASGYGRADNGFHSSTDKRAAIMS